MATTIIVDDDTDMRLLVRAELELAGLGLDLVEACDGQEAVERWEALHRSGTPCVVVIDHRMPRLTGLDAAARILGEEPAQAVILYSANLDEEIRSRAAQLGIVHCLHKDEVIAIPGLVRALLNARS